MLLHTSAFAEELDVGITSSKQSVDVNHRGTVIAIQRIQDSNHKLADDFAKTSRPCPPFCIHAMKAAPGIETVGELELLDFLDQQVATGKGLLIDARMPKFYNSETIPGSINIPFVLFTTAIDEVLPLLGANNDSSWNFDDAKQLLLWCNGPWCDQSPRALNALADAGYPSEKLRYYRGGMQLWKVLGLTTIQPVSNEVGKE